VSHQPISDVPVDLDARELPDYRPISGLAFVALLAGLASAAALAHPILWCLPLLGLVVSLVALRRLAAAERPMVGRRAAVGGLALSLVFGVAAPTRFFSRQFWLQARAEHVAEQWFDDLRTGQIGQAYELLRHVGSSSHPPPKPHDDAAAAAAEEAKTELQLFAERQPIARLLTLGNQAQPQCLDAEVLPDALGLETVLLLYHVRFPGEDALHPLGVQFNVQRRLEPGGERWLITSVTPSR